MILGNFEDHRTLLDRLVGARLTAEVPITLFLSLTAEKTRLLREPSEDGKYSYEKTRRKSADEALTPYEPGHSICSWIHWRSCEPASSILEPGRFLPVSSDSNSDDDKMNRCTYHAGWGLPHSGATRREERYYCEQQLSAHTFCYSNHTSERYRRASDVRDTPALSTRSGVVERGE